MEFTPLNQIGGMEIFLLSFLLQVSKKFDYSLYFTLHFLYQTPGQFKFLLLFLILQIVLCAHASCQKIAIGVSMCSKLSLPLF